jgi:hypothetical protein
VPTDHRRRVALAFLAAALLSSLWLLGPAAPPAGACSCAETNDEELFARADAVFVGQVLDYEPPPPAEVMSSGDPATWTLGVTEVYKGEVTAVQEIVSAVESATCGVRLDGADEFLVFANLGDGPVPITAGQYWASSCSGTRPADLQPLAVDAQATPPLPVADGVPSASAAGTERARLWWPWVAGAAVVAVVAGLVVRRTRAD